jgi:hypothetical protein
MPGNDLADDAGWLVEVESEGVVVELGQGTLLRSQNPGEVAEDVDGQRDVGSPRLAHRFAVDSAPGRCGVEGDLDVLGGGSGGLPDYLADDGRDVFVALAQQRGNALAADPVVEAGLEGDDAALGAGRGTYGHCILPVSRVTLGPSARTVARATLQQRCPSASPVVGTAAMSKAQVRHVGLRFRAWISRSAPDPHSPLAR